MPYSARSIQVLALTVLMLAAGVSASQAAIISFSGNLSIVPTPASVDLDAYESDDVLIVFSEQQNVLLQDDLRVNFTEPGLYDDRSDLPTPVPRIAAGTLVDSYFLHADPVTGGILYSGSITFDTDVLGVIVGGVLLDESDDIIGSPTTFYAWDYYGAGRGLALSGRDTIELSLDRRTITFSFTTRRLMDEVRVITAASVPEPGALLLMGTALAAVAGRRRLRG
jgi:hypothetical protein